MTSHNFVEPLVLSVSDFSWLCPWIFKARVDPSSPMLCSHLCIMILSQLWISRPGLVLILHFGMVRLPLEWPPSVTSGTARGRFEPRTSWPKARHLSRASYAWNSLWPIVECHLLTLFFSSISFSSYQPNWTFRLLLLTHKENLIFHIGWGIIADKLSRPTDK